MALWYIDPSITDAQESDSFVGQFGTGKLRNSWADVTWTAGDRYYQRADSTFTTAVGGPGRIGINANGTRSNPIYIGKYGIGGSPVVLDWSDAFFNFQGRQHVIAEDFDIYAKNGASSAYGANCYGSASAKAINLQIRRCRFWDQYVSALYCAATAIDQLAAEEVVWESCEIYRPNASAIFFSGDIYGLKAARNKVYGPSAASNNSLVGCHPFRASVTTGWTLSGGSVYQRTVGAQTWKTTVTDVYNVNYNATTTLTRNTATPTTPGSNEYGFTAGVLYVNVGTDPNGETTTFTYSDMFAVICWNEIYDAADPTGNEGRGIQLDDGTCNVMAIGNYVARCLRGIDCNQGRNNLIMGNVIEDCVEDGIQAGVQGARGNKVYNNTVVGSGAIGLNLGTAGTAANEAINNIVVGYATGIRGTSGSTENYNCVYGHVLVRSGGVAAGAQTVTIDPQLMADYSPGNIALLGAGTYIRGRDFYGKDFRSPPTIGAVQAQAARTLAASRTVALRRGVS